VVLDLEGRAEDEAEGCSYLRSITRAFLMLRPDAAWRSFRVGKRIKLKTSKRFLGMVGELDMT